MVNTLQGTTHFQRCLLRLKQDVLRMGALVEESFRLSHQCLFTGNLKVAKEFSLRDKRIDKYYHKIEEDCATIITLQAPIAKELRILSAFMQLVRDLERIGDYAENLTETAVKLFPYPPHPAMKEIEEMSNCAQGMLLHSLQALVQLDGTAGQIVHNLDDEVDAAHDRIYQILAAERDIQGVVEPILLLGLVIRDLERMADHATNIAQRVSYIVNGYRE